jgi:hypothetical protein
LVTVAFGSTLVLDFIVVVQGIAFVETVIHHHFILVAWNPTTVAKRFEVFGPRRAGMFF